MTADIEFFFDPACPFCWVTSRWVEEVRRERPLDVRWRLISLRLLNEEPGAYDDKPDLYPAEHERGLEMLRVCAAVRDAEGEDVLGDLYTAMGEAVWGAEPAGPSFDDVLADVAEGRDLRAILERAGLDPSYAEAAADDRWDDVLRAERDEALERVGGDVGTPIVSLSPPDGPAFFGPVIAEPPTGHEAVELWEAVETLGRWPGFAELKRTLRDFPRTPLTADLDDPAARRAS